MWAGDGGAARIAVKEGFPREGDLRADISRPCIGDFVVILPNVSIYTQSHNPIFAVDSIPKSSKPESSISVLLSL